MTQAQKDRSAELAAQAVTVAMQCCQRAGIVDADEHLLRAANALLLVRRRAVTQEQAP